MAATKNITANTLLSEALKWDGYLEKKTNAYLDDLTANAGEGNFTCFGRDYDKIMNTRKNGYAWCAMYLSMMFVYAFGLEKAKEMIGDNLFCSCTSWYNALNKKGQIFSTPQVGDLIFFVGTSASKSGHVGLVTKVDKTKVYTIEGNTSSAPGMIDNGGCVRQKSYSLTYKKIKGYGRPLYKETVSNTSSVNKGVNTVTIELPIIKRSSKGEAVKTLQRLLKSLGYKDSKGKDLVIDGEAGANTIFALKNYQKDHQTECGKPDEVCGQKTWNSILN